MEAGSGNAARIFKMKNSKVKQSDIDKVASAAIFDDTTSDDMENPDYERTKEFLYGETGFGALRQPMPDTHEVDMSDMWSVLDDMRWLETIGLWDYPNPEDIDRCIQGMRRKLCAALGIPEEEYETRFKEGDLPF